jgi:hypothetical protein
MFVDDVLLLSRAHLAEWTTIQEVLQHFCSATGLSINLSKSSVYYWGLSAPELLDFKASLPFSFFDLGEGFKYLGFQLKIGAYSPADWHWLVNLFERKINFWCNKWLSIGGRLILVKSVLESLAVFWMSLAKIPQKTLNSLRRLASNFLWNGHGKKHSFHLSSWASLTTPKKAGGWGLRDLSLFNIALLVSSLWRAVNLNSIWHRIVAGKYLGSQSLCSWLRKPSLKLNRASIFWKGMIASSPVILHWLRWKPGSGTEIRLGRDQIVGLDEKSLPHTDLCLKLSSLNLFSLAQVRSATDNPTWSDNWLRRSELNLDGRWALEWNRYSSALKSAGISLTIVPDSLL